MAKDVNPINESARLGWIYGAYGIQTVELLSLGKIRATVRFRYKKAGEIVAGPTTSIPSSSVFKNLAAAKKAATAEIKKEANAAIKETVKHFQAEIAAVKKFKS